MTTPWHSFSPEEHERHFNPQRAVPDFAAWRARREPANEAARTALRRHTASYGAHPLRTLDIFPAATPGPAPVHVFFHGGYWRAQDKDNFAFVAPPLVAHGTVAVVANYELCPEATLDGVVDSALAALDWVVGNIGRHGGDPGRITLSGHSAGAHLVAEALAAERPAFGAIRRAVLVSGIYDPAPARLTTVDAQLRLTAELAARHDMERRLPRVRCPVHLFAGGQEPWGWIEQTFRYAHHLRRHGHDPEVHVLPGEDHFSIMGQFADPTSPIGRAVLA